MCIICVSTATVATLLAPAQQPVHINTVVKESYVQEFYSTKKSEYKFTNKLCSKSELNKVKKNTICLKNGKVYRWTIKKDLPITKNQFSKNDISNGQSTGLMTYSTPTQPGVNIETCKIKENNNNRRGMLNPLAAGFPSVTIAQKIGTVKWALIPIDFPDLAGEDNFKSRVDDDMKYLSEWFETVSEGKFKVEWVVADNWVRLPNPSNDYKIDRSDNLDRVPNGLKLWNDAMTQSDKIFDFTGVQTVNFVLPKGQNFITETSQGFPWDAAVKNLVTNEGSVSSFSIPGKFMDSDKKRYWSYWMHEFGHAMALPHVGSSREPNPFLGLDIMGNQDGESRELSGWMRFVAGWLSDERVYCQEFNKLKSTDITLIPLNSSDKGIKMVVIPISETKAVVIESRRENKFSCQMPSKRNGILVYTYDATLSHGENFLKPIVPVERGIEYSSDCLVVGYPNPILYREQKVTVEGVTIEVIDNLNYDKIKIIKNN
jgi:M6 family metalloprotease-like protein